MDTFCMALAIISQQQPHKRLVLQQPVLSAAFSPCSSKAFPTLVDCHARSFSSVLHDGLQKHDPIPPTELISN